MRTISIITPLYNCAATLPETLASIFAQDYADWELILFDDGSTDESLQLAAQAAAADPARVSVHRHADGANHGPGCTRNRAAALATAPYLIFLDADDVWLPGILRDHLAWLEREPQAGMVWGPAEYFGEKIKPYRQPVTFDTLQERFAPGEMAAEFLRSSLGTPCPGSVLLRAGAFRQVGGFEENLRRGEDIALWVKIAICHPVLFHDRIYMRYRRHSGSSTSQSWKTGMKQTWELEYAAWLLGYIRDQQPAARLLRLAEEQYHNALYSYTAGSGYLARRRAITRELRRFPGLLKRHGWRLLLDWLLPVQISKRVAYRLARLSGQQ